MGAGQSLPGARLKEASFVPPSLGGPGGGLFFMTGGYPCGVEAQGASLLEKSGFAVSFRARGGRRQRENSFSSRCASSAVSVPQIF